MRNLLHPVDRDRLAAHLRGAMLRDVVVGGQRLIGLAETGGVEAGSFCAAPSNALAAELLAQPDIRDADPGFADGILDFVVAMADAPLSCRRAAVGGIEVLRDSPTDFEILTPFHRFTGDLSAGLVRQQMRGRHPVAAAVLHTGNLVEFRLDRHRSGVDAEDTISHFALRRVPDGVVLMHESRIVGTAGLFRPRQVEAGTLRYQYEIRAGSPLLRLSVTFTAAARQKVRHLRVTTAVDQLGAEGLEWSEGVLGAEPDKSGAVAWRDFGVPKLAGLSIWAEAKPVSHLALGRAGWPDRAAILHIRPAAPASVMSVKAVATRAGALHWLILRHGPADLAPGGTQLVQEDRLLAKGGTAESTSRAMATAVQAGDAVLGLDLEPLPPSGAALNAVAFHLLMAAHGAYQVPLPQARVATLEAWFDRHLAALMAGQPGIADLAYATLAAETRMRAGAAATAFGGLMQRLLASQAADGRFHADGRQAATLADHAVAMLALARALPFFDPAQLAEPIARALAAVRPGVVAMQDGESTTVVEGLALAGAGPAPLRHHALSVGLVARAAGAVLLAAEVRPGALPAEVLAQAQALHRQAVALLRPLVRPRGTALEVAPSPLGGEADPAGQAAAVLGLMAPDSAILQLASVAA